MSWLGEVGIHDTCDISRPVPELVDVDGSDKTSSTRQTGERRPLSVSGRFHTADFIFWVPSPPIEEYRVQNKPVPWSN